jgi:5-oxopent-3-ene-1,2,5-tricarboxylate decarboxylase/2-hydroxyhepta-2,4-diene-1,7-dioate isomerase
VPCAQLGDLDALALRVRIDGAVVQETITGGMLRPVAQLIADVTEFMTLAPGDVLMLGVPHAAPVARAGQSVMVEIEGLGPLGVALVPEDGAR